MPIHVYPVPDDTHVLKGTECWCHPRIEWICPESGLPYARGPLVIHNEPPYKPEPRGNTKVEDGQPWWAVGPK